MSRPKAALAVAVALLVGLVAIVLIAGGDGDDGPGDPERFSYTVSGGIAGLDRRLEVDGERVTLAEGGREPVAVGVDPTLLAGARAALRAAPLAEIAATAPPPGEPIPDDIGYELTVDEVRITASQAAGVDERLQPVIDALDPLLVAAVDQVDPTRSARP